MVILCLLQVSYYINGLRRTGQHSAGGGVSITSVNYDTKIGGKCHMDELKYYYRVLNSAGE